MNLKKTMIVIVLGLTVMLFSGLTISLNGADGEECNVCFGLPDHRDYCDGGEQLGEGDTGYHRCVGTTCHSKYWVDCNYEMPDGSIRFQRITIDVFAHGCCSEDPWGFWQ